MTKKANVNRNNRNLTIDLLKFLFVMAVVLYHSKNLVGDEKCTPMFVGGVFGVEFFFLTSGYFLAASASKKPYIKEVSLGIDTRDFMIHKISGLLPNYYVAWIIAFAVKNIFRPPISGSLFVDLANSIWELLFLEMTGLGTGKYIVNNVTWYISAMLIVMLPLYPLIRKYKDTFFYVIAPLSSVILLGIIYQDFTNLKKPYYFVAGLVMKGTIRAFAEISLGCVIYKVAEKLKGVSFRLSSKIIFTVAEIIIWTAAIVYLYGHPRDMTKKTDFFILLIIAFALLITTSKASALSSFSWGGPAGKSIIAWLGEYSFSLYLGHGYWSQVFNKMSIAQGLTYWEKVPIYLAISFATGLFIMYFSKAIKYIWKKREKSIARIFLESLDKEPE